MRKNYQKQTVYSHIAAIRIARAALNARKRVEPVHLASAPNKIPHKKSVYRNWIHFETCSRNFS